MKKKQLSSATNIGKDSSQSCLPLIASQEATPIPWIMVLELSFFFCQIDLFEKVILMCTTPLHPPASVNCSLNLVCILTHDIEYI